MFSDWLAPKALKQNIVPNLKQVRAQYLVHVNKQESKQTTQFFGHNRQTNKPIFLLPINILWKDNNKSEIWHYPGCFYLGVSSLKSNYIGEDVQKY